MHPHTRETFAHAMREADRHARRHIVPDTATALGLAVLGILAFVLAIILNQ